MSGYQQVFDPVGGAPGRSAPFAALPLVTLPLLPTGSHRRTWQASLAALAAGLAFVAAQFAADHLSYETTGIVAAFAGALAACALPRVPDRKAVR